jgi:hypothetical protein
MRSSSPLRLSGYCGADAGGWLTWPMEAERREGETRAVPVPAAALPPVAGAAVAGVAVAVVAEVGAAARVPGAARPVRVGSEAELGQRRAPASAAAAVPDGVQLPAAQLTPGGADRCSVTAPRATVAGGAPGTSGPRERTRKQVPAGHRVAQPRAREAPAGQAAARQGPVGQGPVGQRPVGQRPVGQRPVRQGPVGQRTARQGPVGQRTAGRGHGKTRPALPVGRVREPPEATLAPRALQAAPMAANAEAGPARTVALMPRRARCEGRAPAPTRSGRRADEAVIAFREAPAAGERRAVQVRVTLVSSASARVLARGQSMMAPPGRDAAPRARPVVVRGGPPARAAPRRPVVAGPLRRPRRALRGRAFPRRSAPSSLTPRRGLS